MFVLDQVSQLLYASVIGGLHHGVAAGQLKERQVGGPSVITVLPPGATAGVALGVLIA